jgi:hypothetical protein
MAYSPSFPLTVSTRIISVSVIEHDAIMIDVPLRIVHCDVPLSGPPLRINVHPTDDAIRRGIDVAFSI